MRTFATAVLATACATLIACSPTPPPQIIYVPVQPGQVINQQGQPTYPQQAQPLQLQQGSYSQQAPAADSGLGVGSALAGAAVGAAAMHLLSKPGQQAQPLPPVNVPTIGTPDSGRRSPVIAPVAPAQAPVKAPALPAPAALPPKPTTSFAVPHNYKVTSAPKPAIPKPSFSSFSKPSKK